MRYFPPLALLLLAHVASAQDARTITEPVLPPACAVLIANHQAADSPGQNDAARIQHAINACAPGRSVRLAASNEHVAFVSNPLTLKSGVTLVVEAGATLYATTDPLAYDRGAKTCGGNDAVGKGCRPFITVTDAVGAGIMGGGAIDGQGGHTIDGKPESWWQIARRAQKEDSRQNVPRLIEVNGARDFTLYGITLRNSANFHVTLNQVDGFTAWGVKIDTPATARNTDGIDPISSRNITIAHSFIRTGDDNVAVKAGRYGPTENVSILHNHFYSGHGMSIGSETNGGVHHMLVEDLTLDGTTSGLRIKSDISRGGLVTDVRYRDVCLRDVRAPLDLTTNYNPQAKGELVPIYRDVLFEHVHSITPGRIILQGLDEQHPLRIVVHDLVVDGKYELQVRHAQLAQGFAGEPAQLNPPGARGIACEGRFAPFPQAPVVDKRPQMTAEQAKAYAYTEVLKYAGTIGHERIDAWDPLADPLATGAAFTPDFTVDAQAQADGATTFATVQAALNRALADKVRTRRVYILVKPGLYHELVYVPASNAPITLYGIGASASDTRISANLDAAVSGAAYARQFGAQFAQADPAVVAMYASLKDRPIIQTSGATVAWIMNQGFQARNLTFENAFNRATGEPKDLCPSGDCPDQGVNAQMNVVHHQAVALTVDGADRAQFENVRLIGFQDTLFLRSSAPGVTTRSFFNKSHIEGDVDFIFGDTVAYFRDCEVKSIGDRSTSYVGAPNTNVHAKYGFVFDHCSFVHDGSPNALAGKFYLARQWFHSQRCTPYGAVPVEGYICALAKADGYAAPRGTISQGVLESVGKMVVMNSHIGVHINRGNPWSDWNKNGTLPYRPAQLSFDDFRANLAAVHIDAARELGDAALTSPAATFLAEFNNTYD